MYQIETILTHLGLVTPDQGPTYRSMRESRNLLRSPKQRPNPSNLNELRLSLLRAGHSYGLRARLDEDEQRLTITDRTGHWFIHVAPDPEAAELAADEPFARPAFNAAGKFNEPDETGAAVDRAFSAISLGAHYDVVGRWINSYRASSAKFDLDILEDYSDDAPGPIDEHGNIHYQDSAPETQYDGWGQEGLPFLA